MSDNVNFSFSIIKKFTIRMLCICLHHSDMANNYRRIYRPDEEPIAEGKGNAWSAILRPFCMKVIDVLKHIEQCQKKTKNEKRRDCEQAALAGARAREDGADEATIAEASKPKWIEPDILVKGCDVLTEIINYPLYMPVISDIHLNNIFTAFASNKKTMTGLVEIARLYRCLITGTDKTPLTISSAEILTLKGYEVKHDALKIGFMALGRTEKAIDGKAKTIMFRPHRGEHFIWSSMHTGNPMFDKVALDAEKNRNILTV